MEFSRRTFLKGSIVGGAGLTALGFDLTPVYAQTQNLKIARATETRSTCPYCSVSCGVIIYTLGTRRKTRSPRSYTSKATRITPLIAELSVPRDRRSSRTS